MKRRFRLTRSSDFKRVRNTGRSYAHPLVVLYAAASGETSTRVGISASRAIGNAVQRNRAKRLLRAATAELIPTVPPGVDLLLVARSPLLQAKSPEVQAALVSLLERAGFATLS